MEIPHETRESFRCDVTSDVSPTGNPDFAFTGRKERPTVFHSGAWADVAEQLLDGKWRRPAFTPIVGVDVVLARGHYVVWCRMAQGSETPIQLIDTLDVT